MTYEGNQGIDLWFKGAGKSFGRLAVAEAKGGRYSMSLGSLSKTTAGRQGGPDWVFSRLNRAVTADVAHADTLMAAFGNEERDMFIGLARAEALYKVDPNVWTQGMGNIKFGRNHFGLQLIE